jgi:hypothetical protein
MVSADKLGSRSWPTRCPTARESSSTRPLANPLCHRSLSEEIAVTSTEKLDSSASCPFIVFKEMADDPEAMVGETASALDARYGLEVDYESVERLCEEHELDFPVEE